MELLEDETNEKTNRKKEKQKMIDEELLEEIREKNWDDIDYPDNDPEQYLVDMETDTGDFKTEIFYKKSEFMDFVKEIVEDALDGMYTTCEDGYWTTVADIKVFFDNEFQYMISVDLEKKTIQVGARVFDTLRKFIDYFEGYLV